MRRFLFGAGLVALLAVPVLQAVQYVPGTQVSNTVTNDAVEGATTHAVFENLETNVNSMILAYDYYSSSNPSNFITLADVPAQATNFYGFSRVVAIATATPKTNVTFDAYETVIISGSSPVADFSAPGGSEYNTSSGTWTPSVGGVYLVVATLNVVDARPDPEDIGLYFTLDNNVDPVVRLQVDKYTEEAAGARSGSAILEMDGVDDTLYMQWLVTASSTGTPSQVTYTGGTFGAAYLGTR
jgi:hypothetical protein